MAKRSSKEPTAADQRAATKLRAIWDEFRKREKWTQETLAAAYGASTQGAISHYLTGRTPIGPVATLKFARIFRVLPTDIRDDFEFSIVPGDLPKDVIEAAIKLATLPANVRHDFAKLIDTMASSSYPVYLDRVSTFRSESIHEPRIEAPAAPKGDH